MSDKEWFSSWFDTKYYHILYKNRDDQEAKRFVSNLVEKLNLQPGTRVLDLACGKGRHSITLNKKGLDVLGVDLSSSSIQAAKNFENEQLHFAVHDMREALNEQFEVIFNLFTSFGYFDDIADNDKVVRSMNEMLQENGLLVIDFMNSHKVIQNLVANETKCIDGIDFKIERQIDNKRIIKDIRFSADGRNYHYTESVQALGLDDFRQLLDRHDLTIERIYGDFNLNEFDKETSDRLIIIARKTT